MTIQPIRKGIKKFNMTIFLCWNFHASYLNKMIYIWKGCIFSTHLFGHPTSAEHICLSHKHVRNSTFFLLFIYFHFYLCIQMGIIKWTICLHMVGEDIYSNKSAYSHSIKTYIFEEARLIASNWIHENFRSNGSYLFSLNYNT